MICDLQSHFEDASNPSKKLIQTTDGNHSHNCHYPLLKLGQKTMVGYGGDKDKVAIGTINVFPN